MDSLQHTAKVAELLMQNTYTINGNTIKITDYGYSFDYGNYKRAFGKCNITKKIISLSKPWVSENLDNNAQIVDTIKHEIAHAIAYEPYKNASHDHVWKSVAKQVGAKPQSCFNAQKNGLKQPRGKYIYVCPACKKEHHFYRKLKRQKSCGVCSNTFNPKYILQPKQ